MLKCNRNQEFIRRLSSQRLRGIVAVHDSVIGRTLDYYISIFVYVAGCVYDCDPVNFNQRKLVD